MSRMTIAQKRWIEVNKLAKLKNAEPTEEDIREASRNMNSLYRLVGLSERNMYLSNDERTANLKSTARSEDREYRWMRRLEKTFKETYGLKLVFPGLYPTFEHREIELYFYD